jgi:ParB-like chromosome segregation protein Spo0J
VKLYDFPVGKVKFLPYNPNRLPPAQVDALSASHSDFGVLQNIVVNERRGKSWAKADLGLYVVGGEHRLQVARKLGMKTYPGIRVKVGPDEERVMNLALNNHGDYDYRSLAKLLKELEGTKAKLNSTGFTDDQVKQLIARYDADLEAKKAFPDVTVEAGHRCPKCGFEWKGACRE